MSDSASLLAFLDEYPVTVEMPVAWGEMDAFGHVNNAVYFRYFESARIACFDRVSYPALMEKTGCGPILAATDCNFRVALTYPDRLVTGSVIEHIGEDDFVMAYAVFSRRHDKVAARGSGRIVSFDYRGQTRTPIPTRIRSGLEQLRRGS